MIFIILTKSTLITASLTHSGLLSPLLHFSDLISAKFSYRSSGSTRVEP